MDSSYSGVGGASVGRLMATLVEWPQEDDRVVVCFASERQTKRITVDIRPRHPPARPEGPAPPARPRASPGSVRWGAESRRSNAEHRRLTVTQVDRVVVWSQVHVDKATKAGALAPVLQQKIGACDVAGCT